MFVPRVSLNYGGNTDNRLTRLGLKIPKITEIYESEENQVSSDSVCESQGQIE